jgi:hypothetical protein
MLVLLVDFVDVNETHLLFDELPGQRVHAFTDALLIASDIQVELVLLLVNSYQEQHGRLELVDGNKFLGHGTPSPILIAVDSFLCEDINLVLGVIIFECIAIG